MMGAWDTRRFALAAPLAAQRAAPPAVGETVRLSAPAAAPGTLRGELVARRGDTLFVRRENATAPVAVRMAQVEWIDVRRPRGWLAGLGRGVLIGAPAGFGGGYLLGSMAEGGVDECADDCGLLTAAGAAAGLVTGTLLGALVGGSAPGGRWVRTEPRVHAAAAPQGVALSMTITL